MYLYSSKIKNELMNKELIDIFRMEYGINLEEMTYIKDFLKKRTAEEKAICDFFKQNQPKKFITYTLGDENIIRKQYSNVIRENAKIVGTFTGVQKSNNKPIIALYGIEIEVNNEIKYDLLEGYINREIITIYTGKDTLLDNNMTPYNGNDDIIKKYVTVN